MSDPYPVYVNDPLTGAIRAVQPSIPQPRVGQDGRVTTRPTMSKRARFERAPKRTVVIDRDSRDRDYADPPQQLVRCEVCTVAHEHWTPVYHVAPAHKPARHRTRK